MCPSSRGLWQRVSLELRALAACVPRAEASGNASTSHRQATSRAPAEHQLWQRQAPANVKQQPAPGNNNHRPSHPLVEMLMQMSVSLQMSSPLSPLHQQPSGTSRHQAPSNIVRPRPWWKCECHCPCPCKCHCPCHHCTSHRQAHANVKYQQPSPVPVHGGNVLVTTTPSVLDATVRVTVTALVCNVRRRPWLLGPS